MSLLWELFQEYQINNRKKDNRSLEETVLDQDDEIAGLCDIVGQMAQRIDQLEAEVYGASTNG